MRNTYQDLDAEISQGIRSGWKAFTTKDVLKAKLDKILHVNLFNSTVLPVILYTSETWATIKTEKQRLVMVYGAMEKSIQEISLHEYI